MVEVSPSGITPEEVDRRLRELAELYDLGMALREVRFIDPDLPDRVRERPDSKGTRPDGDIAKRGG